MGANLRTRDVSALQQRRGRRKTIGVSLVPWQIRSSPSRLGHHLPFLENGDEVLAYYTLPGEVPNTGAKYFKIVK